jgi:hypothetical protein
LKGFRHVLALLVQAGTVQPQDTEIEHLARGVADLLNALGQRGNEASHHRDAVDLAELLSQSVQRQTDRMSLVGCVASRV